MAAKNPNEPDIDEKEQIAIRQQAIKDGWSDKTRRLRLVESNELVGWMPPIVGVEVPDAYDLYDREYGSVELP